MKSDYQTNAIRPINTLKTSTTPPIIVLKRTGFGLHIPITGIAYVRIDDKPEYDGKQVYIHLSNGSSLSCTKDEYRETMCSIYGSQLSDLF